MSGPPNAGFPNDSTLPLLAAFVLALCFLGGVVAVGLSDGADGTPAASTTDTIPVFEEEPTPRVTLTLDTAGGGKGTVRVAGEERVCSAECNFEMDRETSVTIIARAAGGSKFVTWTGSCGGGRICTLYMDRSRTVTALFTSTAPVAPPPTADCKDGLDNDSDGFPDDADPDCFTGKSEAGDEADPLLDDVAPEPEVAPPPPVAPQPVVPPPVVPPPVVPPPPPVDLPPDPEFDEP
jgi:hypothetical protein